MEIKVVRNNDGSVESATVAVDEINSEGHSSTYRDVLSDPGCMEFIGGENTELNVDDMIERFIQINGSDIPSGLKSIVLDSKASDGDVMKFSTDDIDYGSDEDGDDDEEDDVPVEGHVYVLTSGGLNSTPIHVVDGQTTVRQCVANDVVRNSTGLSDGQLFGGTITLNGVQVSGSELEATCVHVGDRIMISPHKAHDKGLEEDK